MAEYLREHGFEVADPNEYIPINAIWVSGEVVYAIANPDPLKEIPYSCISFVRVPGSLYGKGIPELMLDCVDAANASLRNLMDNLAFAAAPQTAIDIDSLHSSQVPPPGKSLQVFPRKAWLYHGQKVPGATRQPIYFFQATAIITELLTVYQLFKDESDERTMIPRYQYGPENLQGAGQTARGLSMLMSNAGRTIKLVLSRMDMYVIRPAIQRMYRWNLMYHPDQSIKGDAQVVAQGIMAVLQREQDHLQLREFAQTVGGPADYAHILGIEGLRFLLERIAQGLNIPVDKLVPTETELRARLDQEAAAAAAAAMAQQRPQEAPNAA